MNKNTSTALAEKAPDTTPARSIGDGKITNRILEEIQGLERKNGIILPPNYDVAGALNAAWLELQTVVNKDKKPVIVNGQVNTDVVTMASVANALRNYCTQGLNCAKNQAYFIVYDNELAMQRSYFGDKLVAKTVRPGIEFYEDVVYEGEQITTKKVWSKQAGFIEVLDSHSKVFPRKSGNVIAAYCGVVDTETGEDLGLILMDIDRIKKSWMMSKPYKYAKDRNDTTHGNFPDDMAIRTVVRRRSKPIINSSDDKVLLASVASSDIDATEAEIAADVEEHGNGELITMAPPSLPQQQPPVIDASTLTEQDLIKRLALKPGEIDYLRGNVGDKGLLLEDLLRDSFERGAKNYADVSKYLESLPDPKSGAQPSLVSPEEPY